MSSYRVLSCSYLGAITDALLDYSSIAELRQQVIVSVTKTVFRVCLTVKKVPENFAETLDFGFLLTIVFFGSGLLVIFLKASQMQN